MGVTIYHDRGMQTLHVTAHLAERMVARTGDLPALDGILAARRLAMVPPDERPRSITRADDTADDIRIRVAKWSAEPADDTRADLLDAHGRIWGYVCTAPHIVGDALRSSESLRKMTDVRAMAQLTDARNVNVGAGPTKSHDLRIATVSCSAIEWWIVAERKELRRRYLRLDADGRGAVTRIGGKRGMGYGTILRWEIESSDVSDDWILQRRWMPAWLHGGVGEMHGIRPPYWHRSRLVPCTAPQW